MNNWNKNTFHDLYRKWYNTIGDPSKNLIVSTNGRAMSWRMGFFYIARIMAVDVARKPIKGEIETAEAISRFEFNALIEINVKTILN